MSLFGEKYVSFDLSKIDSSFNAKEQDKYFGKKIFSPLIKGGVLFNVLYIIDLAELLPLKIILNSILGLIYQNTGLQWFSQDDSSIYFTDFYLFIRLTNDCIIELLLI